MAYAQGVVDTVATGTITTQNLVPAGAATAGSSVAIGPVDHAGTLAIEVTGVYTGALTMQGSIDGVTWTNGARAGSLISFGSGSTFADTINSAANGLYQCDAVGFRYVRMTALSAVTGTATLTISMTAGSRAVINSPIIATPATPTGFNLSSANTTNATSVKASAGTLYTITCSNTGAAAAFVKLYNKASAPTVGTDVPTLTLSLPASGTVTVDANLGVRFATGIALAITNLAADSDTTVVAAAQVKVMASYI